MNATQRLGWGLIGPGRFAREFAEELVAFEGARPVAVASQNADRAAAFAVDHGFERSYGSYRELIEDAEVDIVYVVVPHVFHREVAELALRAGKAVLCEKPLTASAAETRALIGAAQESGALLMEAMKTAFLPAILQARDWIREGRIGEPRLLRADFCFRGSTDPADRLMNPQLGGGSVLDVGIYPIFLSRFLLGEMRSVRASGRLTETGVEDAVAMSADHEGGGVSSLTCSFDADEAMDASILGTEGRIDLPKFHAGTRATLRTADGEVETFEDPTDGMVRAEIEAMTSAFAAGQLECPGHPHAETLRLAEIADEVISQVRAAG